MKKLTVSILAIVLLAGCKGDPNNNYTPTEDTRYIIIKIQECEYIKAAYRSDVPLIHKANCNNPIHKR